MNLQRELWFSLFFIITEQFSTVRINSSQCNTSIFGRLLDALSKDVEFMHTRSNQLNIDAAFGLALAEANLKALLASENSEYIDEDDRNLILQIREFAKDTREQVTENLEAEKDRLFSKVFTEVDLWVRPIHWKDNSLAITSLSDSNLSSAEAEDLIHSGSPGENESDYCLMQLMDQYVRREFCQLSNECVQILISADGSRGYAITHRLLIIQVADSLNCEQHPSIGAQQLREEYCRIIYRDLLDLEAANFPGVGVDLAIEQIFLCGMEGYSEFTTSHYKNLLINLQSSVGCYSATGFQADFPMPSYRTKRSSNPMDFGCDNHTCGVAAASLSMLLRECTENHALHRTENLKNQFLQYL